MDLHVTMDEEMAEEDKHLSNDLKSLQMALSQNAFSTFYESVYGMHLWISLLFIFLIRMMFCFKNQIQNLQKLVNILLI